MISSYVPFGITGLIIVGLVSWITKIAMKKRLSEGLGRKVKDHEITSLRAWMDASDKK